MHWNNKQEVLKEVEKNGYALQYAHPFLRKDKEIVLAAVKQYGLTLKWAHSSLQKDKEIVLAAVKQYGYALQFAHPKFKKLIRNYKKPTNKLRFLMDWGEAWTEKFHKELKALKEL